MRLVHRTNFWGRRIDPNDSRQDNEINMDLIWVQALEDDDDPPCCHGFGKRTVDISRNRIFVDWDRGDWILWKVSAVPGRDQSHWFFKFLLIPKGCYGKGKKTLQRRGYAQIAVLNPRDMLKKLAKALQPYWQGDTGAFNHVHIGIFTMGQSLQT